MKALVLPLEKIQIIVFVCRITQPRSILAQAKNVKLPHQPETTFCMIMCVFVRACGEGVAMPLDNLNVLVGTPFPISFNPRQSPMIDK